MAPIALLVSVAVLLLQLIQLPFQILGAILKAYNREQNDKKVRITRSVSHNSKGQVTVKEVRSYKE